LFVRQLVSELTWGLCLPRVSLCLHSPWFVAKSYDAERSKVNDGASADRSGTDFSPQEVLRPSKSPQL
jgi:hypothetical protein